MMDTRLTNKAYMMKLATSTLIATLLLFTGCALSPQVVPVNPALDTTGMAGRGSGPAISVLVTDRRDDAVLGSRGGVYSDTALLTTDAGLTGSIRTAVIAALGRLGYTTLAASNGPSLNIYVDKLEYQALRSNNSLYTISTNADVNVVCRNQLHTLDNNYRVSDKQDYLKAPSERENTTIINKTLASALNRLFEDDKMLDCLQGR